MFISGVSESTNAYQNRMNQLQLVRQDFSGLSTSLASGDLTSAQNAFATLMRDLGNTNAQSTQQTGIRSQIITDFTAIGAALSANDLSAAQKSYATLMQDLQSTNEARQIHRHHHDHQRHRGDTQNTADDLKSLLGCLGTALQSGDLASAQKAFATLTENAGKNGNDSITAEASTSAQSATAVPGGTTASVLDALQAASGVFQKMTASSASALLRALNLRARLGEFDQTGAAGLFSTIA